VDYHGQAKANGTDAATRLHYGKNRSKLVRFKKQNFFYMLINLAQSNSVNTALLSSVQRFTNEKLFSSNYQNAAFYASAGF